MKNAIIPLIASAHLLMADGSNYTNAITQTFEDGTSVYLQVGGSTNIPSSGSGVSPSPIIGKSIYELHTTHNETGQSHTLDTHVTNGYLPNPTVSVDTPDPRFIAENLKYTRVNRPYTISYEVTGILPDSELPEANSMLLYKDTKEWNRLGILSETTESSLITTNGTKNTNVPADMNDDMKVVEHTYTFYENIDATSGYASPLATTTIRIFPNAIGEIKDASGEHFGVLEDSIHEFPQIQVSVTDIYPGSSVKLRFFEKGSTPDLLDDIVPLGDVGMDKAGDRNFPQIEITEALADIDIVPTRTPVTYSIQLIEGSIFGEIILDQAEFTYLLPAAITINAKLVE